MMPENLSMIFMRQRPRILLAIRGTVAALLALLVAVHLKLENPFWAPMTALIVIQPTRGLLLEKSFYRLVGTVAGSSAGLLLILATRSPMVLTVVLLLWVSACVGIGNLLYGLRSYAFMMASCTCSVIAMSGYQNPPHIYDIAFARIVCIIVGIMVTTGVTALFTPRQSPDGVVTERLGRVAVETVGWLALLLRHGQRSSLVRREQDILIEIAGIEGLLDETTAGSFRLKKQKRQCRNLIAALLSLLALGRLAGEQLAQHMSTDKQNGEWSELLARHLDLVAVKLDSSLTISCLDELRAVATEASAHLPLIGDTLKDMVGSLQLVLANHGAMDALPVDQQTSRLIHHRDWQESRRAAFRAALAIAAVGATWALTGWTKGPLMLIAISIMISIFSTKEHPARFVGNIFIGAAIGSLVAVLCRLILLPGVTDPFMIAATIAPFVLIGVFAMQQQRTAIAATDATLFFLFVSQPGVSVVVMPADLALGAVAMVLGVGSAWLAYRYLVPISPAIRLRSLMTAIMQDLEQLAVTDSSVAAGVLTARLQHRVIRLVGLATRNDADHRAIVEGGIAALGVTATVRRLKEMLAAGSLPPAEAGTIRETLMALSNLGHRPGDVPQMLRHVARELFAVLCPEPEEPSSCRVSGNTDGIIAVHSTCWG